MRHVLIALIGSTMLLCVAGAHHSVSNFDRSIVSEISGVVTRFQFMNPHSLIEMDVADGTAGQTRRYRVFATSRVVLQRYGWRPDSVHVGDSISITGHPDEEQPTFIYLTGIEFADGTQWARSEILE
ncbi:MAG: DUF6152 family protein [Gammaproteobacteria bacterium]|jgi:hypothetical protein